MKDRSEDRPRILIAHDDQETASLLQGILLNDYDLSWARTGAELRELASGEPQPDLILIEEELDEGDGYKACHSLKGVERTGSIPVLMIRTESSTIEETRAFEAGAADFITKPIVEVTTQARIRANLELRRLRELTARALSVDPLTEVANQRGVRDLIEKEWSRSAREATSISLLLIRIDAFEQLVEDRGRLAAEDCLLQISNELSAIIRRPMDFLGKYGKEGFAVVLPTTEAYGAVYLAETIRQQVETLNIPNPVSESGFVTVSVGVASAVPYPGGEATPLFDAAKKGVESAQQEGGNQYCQIEPEGE